MNNQIIKKLDKFFSKYKIQEYKKGEILIHAYENPTEIFYLEEGMVKMYTTSKNGDDIIITIFKPNTFFPMSQAVNNINNHYFYESTTNIKIRTAPIEKVLIFLKTNPDILLNLLQRLYRGIDGLVLKMVYAMNGDARSRIIIELLIQAQRFGKKNENQFTVKISMSELALSVGLARETVSREIKKLKNKKLISITNKQLTITNLIRLENELS